MSGNNSLEDIQILENELSQHQLKLDSNSIHFDDSMSDIGVQDNSPESKGSPFEKGTFGKQIEEALDSENKVKRNIKPLTIKLEKTEQPSDSEGSSNIDVEKMGSTEKKEMFKRRQRSLTKTEVVSPVKLSLKRKKSRKITWKQVEDALNADDGAFSPREKRKETQSQELEFEPKHNPNEDTSGEATPKNRDQNDVISEESEQEDENEDNEDDIVGEESPENGSGKKTHLDKILGRIDNSNNYSGNQSRRSIMKQKKALKLKVRDEDEEEIKERLRGLQMMEKDSIEAQESLMNDSGLQIGQSRVGGQQSKNPSKSTF